MARNKGSKQSGRATGKSSRGTRTAKAGLGALVIGAVAWLVGGFTRENAIEWGKTIVIAGSLALVIRWSIAEPFRIPSGSMEPTLHGHPNFLIGDRVFVNKWRYGLRYPFMKKRIYYGDKPKRWDIVVFKSVEEDATKTTLVKRIAGLPGEHVHIEGGHLHVNGEPLPFPPDMPEDMYYTNELEMGIPGMSHREHMKYGILPDEEYSVVPEGHYFLLGDNSEHSRDGRYWGWVPNEHLLGPVTCIWWPPNHMRDFTGFTETWWWRTLLFVLAVFVVVRLFFGRSWHVRSDAVRSALRKGDHAYINRCVFGWPVPFTRRRFTKGREPRRGEIVLYQCSGEEAGEALLGRIAGLPGERVLIEDGVLTINDAPVSEPSVLASLRFDAPEEPAPYGRSRSKSYSLVPDEHYFVLAEVTDEVADSRTQGWVAREELLGTATAVWWPPTRWRRLRD